MPASGAPLWMTMMSVSAWVRQSRSNFEEIWHKKNYFLEFLDYQVAHSITELLIGTDNVLFDDTADDLE